MARRLPWRLRGVFGKRSLKPAATTINALVLVCLCRLEGNQALALASFFAYCFGSDIVFGRCPGMMLANTYHVGTPSVLQKLIYNLSYVGCFAVLMQLEVVSFVAIGLVQIACLMFLKRTTHGLLAGMREPECRWLIYENAC